MKFPTDRPVKVVMLGAGGTGGYVAPYVFRLLHMLDRPARFVVCDGDTEPFRMSLLRAGYYLRRQRGTGKPTGCCALPSWRAASTMTCVQKMPLWMRSSRTQERS